MASADYDIRVDPPTVHVGTTENGALLDIAQRAASHDPIVLERRSDGSMVRGVILEEGQRLELHDDHQPFPRRAQATRRTTDAGAFAAYVARYGTQATTVWADIDTATITAVLDDHEAAYDNDDAVPVRVDGIAGYGDHRITLELRKTDDWKAWAAADRTQVTQGDFAEFLEDYRHCIVKPTAADMLEIAQSFEASIGAEVKSAKRLSNGEVGFTYVENVEGKAGRAGQLEIPTSFDIVVPIFESSATPTSLTARLRWRIVQQKVTFAFILDRLDVALRDAFSDVVTAVESTLPDGVPLFLGKH